MRAKLLESDRKYWGVDARVVDSLARTIPKGARVLEIGPGRSPFPRASVFVDWQNHAGVPAERFVRCNVHREPLPFPDQSFDFIYCRHVLEDLQDPFRLCDEMSRVASAGYAETPSPAAELCRGVDGGSPDWRGYIHHRFVIWPKAGTLQFVVKYPVAEYVCFENEATLVEVLRGEQAHWNTHFLWKGKIRYSFIEHERSYSLPTDYGSILARAVQEGLEASAGFLAGLKAT